MNARTLIILLLAVGSGLGTVVGVRQMQMSNKPSGSTEVETVDVVVTAIDLPMLKVVEEADVSLTPWPEKLVPAGAITNIEDVVGKTVRASKKANQPLFASDVSAGRGIDVLIPDGEAMRLVTILTPSEAANVAGLVQPGDHIDVNLILSHNGSGRDDSPTGGAQARMLLQNVLVVSVGQQVELTEGKDVPGPYQSVSLAVTPEQSLVLQLAQTKGTLTLALRKTGDTDIIDVRPVTLAELQRMDSFSEQSGDTLIAAEETEEAPAETPEPTTESSISSALTSLWNGYAAMSQQAALDTREAEQRLVDQNVRIRTYRGTTSGEVLLRTHKLKTFKETEATASTTGLARKVSTASP